MDLVPGLLWKGDIRSNAIYLTFDDGPDPVSTPIILDILRQFQIKATFFCLGKNVDHYPELYIQILDEGHAVGHHGYEHLSGWSTPTQKYIKNVEKGAARIESHLFRPPYGRISLTQYRKLRKKFRIVMWDLMPGDFLPGTTVPGMSLLLNKNIAPGSIIVLHDKPRTLAKLQELLPVLIEAGKQKGLEWKGIVD